MNNILQRILILFLLVYSLTGIAQTKLLTLEDYSNRKLYPKYLSQLQWMGTTSNLTYIEKNSIIKTSIIKEQRDTILRLAELNQSIEKAGEKKIENFPAIKWINDNSFRFVYNNTIYIYNIKDKTVKVINKYNDKAENADIEMNNYCVAYTIENNLYITDKNQEIQLTDDKDKGIVNGKSVHRDEFGINKGTFWSPKGNMLAFYRMDETMVTDYPLVNIDTRIAEVKNIKYPMAGMKSHEVTVGVYNLKTNKTIFLKTGEPKEQYLTNIAWSPDEKYIYIAVLNRDQNDLKMNKYDVATGEFVKTLFEEVDHKWIDPLNAMYFLKSNPDEFIWQSCRDGYNQLYLYNSEGKLLKQLTKGNWEVTSFLGCFDDDRIYYISNEGSPVERQIFSHNIKTAKKTQLSTTKAYHSANISPDGKYFIDTYSNLNTAIECKIISTEGKEIQTLQRNDNPLKEYKLGETSIFTIKAENGADLYCRMIKPIDFDSHKKYPVMIYVYGGPHSQLITNTWMGGAGMFLNYFATKGYVVFTLDNRGTGNRGSEFEQAIFRELGDVEVKDQMKGISYLKSLSFVDTTKIALHGWSYGGFMTLSTMLKNKGVIKVGVAGGPVVDWKYYEVMYGERYMDTPQDNPEGYEASSTLNYVKNLDGKLLIIHGTMDGTVVWQHSLMFIKKCVDENVQVDYFVYPDHEHNVGGKDRIHLLRKIYNYIDDNISK